MRQGTPDAIAEAERLHKELLPLIVFMMSSVENFIAYGKHLLAKRLGLRACFKSHSEEALRRRISGCKAEMEILRAVPLLRMTR